MEEVGILQDGKTTTSSNDIKAVAKTVKFNDGKYRYFVKVGPEGNMFNPTGLYARSSTHLTSKRMGNPVWKYFEVNETCYNHYISFLSTRNTRDLHYAERELRNA